MLLSKFASSLNCVSVGTIQSFDAQTQTAEVSINLYRTIIGTGQPDTFMEYPLLLNCPVSFLFGGAGSLTFPVQKGDSCILLFCDRDMDTWLASGQVSPPNSLRMHDISDAIAIVGVRPSTRALSNYVTDGVELRLESSRVLLKDSSALMETASAAVECAEKVSVRTAVATLKEALDQFVDAVKSAVTTDGQSMNPATQAALTAVKTKIDQVLQ